MRDVTGVLTSSACIALETVLVHMYCMLSVSLKISHTSER